MFGDVRTHKAQTSDKGPQAWLVVDGLVGTGTGRLTEDCTWYNLNSGRADIRYITHNFDINARPLPYQITSEVHTHDQFHPGGYPVELVYTCRFGVAPGEDWGLDTDSSDIASSGEADAIIAESVQYFTWEEGALRPVNGAGSLYDERDVLASTFMGVCSSRFFELEDRGTKAEKAWAKDVRRLASEQNVSFITLTEQDGRDHMIGRYEGYAKAPRFDDFWVSNPTLECSGGAPIALSFIETPDRGYTLTRYSDDGYSEVVPIDNGVFLAQENAGTMLYTLEGNWYYGTYGFDFNVNVTSRGKAASPFEPEMTSVLERARDYAKQITGVDFSKASGTAVLHKWKTDYQIEGAFDEWDVELLWPNSNIQASIRFELGGKMTFFALFTLGEQKGDYTELPLAPAHEDMAELSAAEKTQAWFERLPIMSMHELKKAEIARKNIDSQYNGRVETAVKLRFDDGSVLTCYLDEETGRLSYFCLYTKETLE